VPLHRAWRTAIPALAGVAAFGATLLLFYPGFQSFDSAYQYWQARTGHYSNQSPVVMTALWGALNAAWPSPAALLVLHLAAYWIGIVLLASAIAEHTIPRVAFILVAGLLPPVLVIIGHLWTDSSLIAAMTLAFGLTVTAYVKRRALALALALPVIIYAGAVRHNSLVAIVPLALLWAAALRDLLPRSEQLGTPSPRRVAVVVVALSVVATALVFGRVLDRTLARERATTWALVAGWDLAALSVREGAMLIPEFARTRGLTLEQLRENYSPYTNVPLFAGDEHVRYGMDTEVYSTEELWRLARAWGGTVLAHPLGYLAHRFAVTGHLFGRYDGPLEGLFFAPAVEPYRDNPPPPPALWAGREQWIDFVRAHRGSWLFAPIGYLIIAVAGSLIGWARRRTPAGVISLALGTSGLLLVLPLVIAAPSAELRYSGWLFVASVVALIAAFAKIAVVDRPGQPEPAIWSLDRARANLPPPWA
jgi:hypothetical protein